MSNPQSWVKYEDLTNDGGRFTIAPLDKGMGNTIGNAMRRVLLSSLSGAAVTSVKIEGVTHEFSTVPNIIEDVLDIICNLKGVIFKTSDNDKKVLTLEASSKGIVSANDLKCDSTIEVVNKDHHIATITAPTTFKIELIVEVGVGFRATQLVKVNEQGVDAITVDASFSPIKRVNQQVESIRVGKELDHDQLFLDVWTDGSINVEEAIREASSILIDKFQLFNSINEEPIVTVSADSDSTEVDNSVLEMAIDDLELSARSSNCLKRAGIETVGELVEKDMSELIQIKNFGKKSADEINGKLAQFNLALKG